MSNFSEGEEQTISVSRQTPLEQNEKIKWSSSDETILEIIPQPNYMQVKFKALKAGDAKIIAQVVSSDDESIS